MAANYEFYSSVTNTGERVRPGNWMYRVAILASKFDNRKRLNYSDALVPMIYNEQRVLRIDKEALRNNFPEIYDNIIEMIAATGAKLLILD